MRSAIDIIKHLVKRSAGLAAAAICGIMLAGCGSGGGGGSAPAPAPPPTDSAAPALSMTKPDKSVFCEGEFRDPSFMMAFSYSDASTMNESSISVIFQMDNGAEQDISSYFAAGSMSTSGGKYNYTIVSSGIYVFNRSLYNITSNNQNRTMKATLTVKDSYGNSATTTSQFVIKPDPVNEACTNTL